MTKDEEQLAALVSVIEALTDRGIDYWLFGGWAVDFYVGKVTRLHFSASIRDGGGGVFGIDASGSFTLPIGHEVALTPLK